MIAQAHPDARPRPCRIRTHHSRAAHATYCRPTVDPDPWYPDYTPADPSAYRRLRRRIRRALTVSAD